MYYIYHIPGVKIGCTNDLEKRMSDQGFTEWEILETHEDGWHAGDREIELQKEYGLPVDKVHYMVSKMSRPVWDDNARQKAKEALKQSEYSHLPEATLKASKKKMKITYEIAEQIRSEGYKPKKNQYQPGPTIKSIAAKYGIGIQIVKGVLHNKTYTHPEWPNKRKG